MGLILELVFFSCSTLLECSACSVILGFCRDNKVYLRHHTEGCS
jgi:hypothetical protein